MLYFFAVGLFLALPLIVVAGVSVNEKQDARLPAAGLLARLVRRRSSPIRNGARRCIASLMLAVCSAALAVAIALPLAWFLWRRIAPWANIFQLLGVAPFMLPPVITALGLLTFWATVGLLRPALDGRRQPRDLLRDAAAGDAVARLRLDRPLAGRGGRHHGCRRPHGLKTVVLPLILPYLVSGYAFAFVLSLNEYIVAYMTVGFTIETLPIKIFNALRYGYTPTMASVSIFFVAMAALVFGLIARFGDLPKLLGAMSSDGK